MGKVIRLTESELIGLVKKVIQEQTIPGLSSYNSSAATTVPVKQNTSNILPCVPEAFKLPVQKLIKDSYNKTILKVALGIIGRESDFGESNRFKFTSQLKSLWAGLGGQTSVGFAQIKPETAKKYGLSVDDLEMALGSLIAAYKVLLDNYNLALKVGYTTNPSSNFKEGTGNSALDIAIAGYNLGESKIVKYCKTNNPEIKKPCSMAGKTIKNENLTVTNQYVPNYLPNFKTDRWDGVKISSQGYVKEVASRLKTYNCF
jgi:hypothetical protein